MIFAIFQLHFYNLWYFGIITLQKKPHTEKFSRCEENYRNEIGLTSFRKNAGFHHFPSLVCPKFVRGPRADRHLAPVHGDWRDLVLVPECDASWTTHRDCCYSRCQTWEGMEMVCSPYTINSWVTTRPDIYCYLI